MACSDNGTKVEEIPGETGNNPLNSFGKMLASPSPGEEVCISGISGVFPKSPNIQEFRNNLMNKLDLIDDDFSRWDFLYPEIPRRSGKIPDINKFDAGFFGIHHKQADCMDPGSRIFLEKTVEAIFDAGLHPSELEGTNTGVFIALNFSESEKNFFQENLEHKQFGITGYLRTMVPNRVSYFLKLKGPSVVIDSACSSSLTAVENAYIAIRTGQCEMAIVGGINLSLHPLVSLQFARLGVLSEDGCCKSFDAMANGYVRSEAVACVLLQKAKYSRRVYATILHSKINCDGYKEQSIAYPSAEARLKLFQDFYKECGIDPRTVNFLEAHGTGTQANDPEECKAMDEFFCRGRGDPLLIGSVKSNMGHTEASAGLCGLMKSIICLEEGYILPNIHYVNPKEGVCAIEEGRIKVVTEMMPIQDDKGLIGVNSCGFGGTNAHVLLRRNTKVKVQDGQPKDSLPRLVCVSGRTPEAVTTLTEDVNSRKLDAEYIQLLQEVFKRDIEGHFYRGYTIVSKEGPMKNSLKYFQGVKPSLFLAFSTFGDSWLSLVKALLAFPVFAASIQRIHDILVIADIGINMNNIIEKRDHDHDHVVENILGNIALQIGILNILIDLELAPDGVEGCGLGELMCAYYNGTFSLEQTLLAAYEVAKSARVEDQQFKNYLIRLGKKGVMKLLPTGIEIMWENTENSTVISGHPEITLGFFENMKGLGIEIRPITPVEMIWLAQKKSEIESNLLPNHKQNTSKLKHGTNGALALTPNLAASENFTKAELDNYCSQDVCSLIEENQVILEIGLGNFAEFLKDIVSFTAEVVKFDIDSAKKGVISLLETFGSLYEYGFNPQIRKLYPGVPYPVSRGTPMISPKIKWQHSEDWYVMSHELIDSLRSGKRIVAVSLGQEQWKYISGHVIDGYTFFPATGYLQVVWETFCLANNIPQHQMNLTLENCCFNRATIVTKNVTKFDIVIEKNRGKFEVMEGGSLIAFGRIYSSSLSDQMTELGQCQAHENKSAVRMKSEDIYKEFNLRGYNYGGAFRGLQGCSQDAKIGWLRWNGNWVTFLDNILQMKILQNDTRQLLLITSIKKLTIDAQRHLQYVKSLGEDPLLPIYVYSELDIVRCGGIEMKGVILRSIPRRNQQCHLVLEKYVFVPNHSNLSIEKSLRINMQIATENNHSNKIKVLEIYDDVAMRRGQPLGPSIYQVFNDAPLIEVDIVIYSEQDLHLPNILVENKKLLTAKDFDLIIGTQILQSSKVLQQAFGALKNNGFILSRETDFDIFSPSRSNVSGINILTIHDVGMEKFVFFKKWIEPKKYQIINISRTDDDMRWLPKLQTAMENKSNVIIFSQNEDCSGLLGFFNCISKEPGGLNCKCFFILDTNAPPFDPNHTFYWEQMKDLSINIYKDGQWGTYRHLGLDETELVDAEHCFVNSLPKNDISSLRWIEGTLNSGSIVPCGRQLVQVYYCSINFKDVMIAFGRINPDISSIGRNQEKSPYGFEFSGRTLNGRRVMGIMSSGAMSTLVAADSYLLWDIPEKWTMEQAATVPLVYGTVLYSFVLIGKIRRGLSVLIHSGAGGIGQAAINVALAYGCTVYTTVGTQEKRDYIKKLFPSITDHHIGNSRDTTFENMIKQGTKGRGVDLVLNSLSEEKLIASVRCLAKGGKFLEIGKFDMTNNNNFGMQLLSRGCSFHGIMLDTVFEFEQAIKKQIRRLISQGIKDGYIRPLNSNLFKMDEIEQAFRFVASGHHIGKVMIQVREEEPVKITLPPVVRHKAYPSFTCNAQKSYIIIGGLGGFGLELIDWLVLKGARNIIISSRSGVRTGYQSYRINIWRSYGAVIRISTADITTKQGCHLLISAAQELGSVESIFNLAVVIKDSLLQNQSLETFRNALGPKAIATEYFDEISRVRCPELSDFVVFTSVSCGRGNAGQSNYAMANSIIERICEKRCRDGYPALAIQWGPVGDVGFMLTLKRDCALKETLGTLNQKISSCLQIMDRFLRQREATIVSSIVIAEKRSSIGNVNNIFSDIADILGIKQNNIPDHTTLAELGMDSLISVQIKRIIEKEFDIFLTDQDLRSMTFGRLREIRQSKESDNEVAIVNERIPSRIEQIFRCFDDEATSMIPLVKLPSLVEENSGAPRIYCFPGIEGFATTLKPLAANLRAEVVGLQYCYNNPTDSYSDLAVKKVGEIEQLLEPKETFYILAYSWGVIIALEVIAILEKRGYVGSLICLDGSPALMREIYEQELKGITDAEMEVVLLCHFMSLWFPNEINSLDRDKLLECNSFEERLELAQKFISKDVTHSRLYLKKMAWSFYTRLRELKNYTRSYQKIQSTVRLFKPSTLSIQNIAEDYELSDMCDNIIEVRGFEGNHITILENKELAEAINDILSQMKTKN